MNNFFVSINNHYQVWVNKLENRTLLFYSFCFIFVSIIYALGLTSGPIGDDYGFIFSSKLMQEAPSPLSFWSLFGDNPYNRTWPMTYSVLWLLTKVFGSHFWLYKAFNLLFHYLNFILFERILKRIGWPHSRFCAFIFLIHPLCVESVVWIFQVKTVLALTCFLACYQLILRYHETDKTKYLGLSLLLFYFSLQFKVMALFMPFIFLFHLKGRKQFIVILFLLLSAYFGHQSMKSVIVYGKGDYQAAKVFHKQFLSEKQNLELLTPVALPQPQASDYYQDLVTNLNSTITKLGISCYTYLFYIKQSLSLSQHFLVYPKFLYEQEGTFYRVLFVLCLIAFGFVYRSWALTFFLFGYLPISGLFYVPYFKYSQVADHWNYLGILGLIAGMGQILHVTRQRAPHFSFLTPVVCLSFIIFLSTKTFHYSSSFKNLEQNFKTNLSHNPGSKILNEYLMHLFIAKEEKSAHEFNDLIAKIYANPDLDFRNLYFTPGEPSEMVRAKVYFQTGLKEEAIITLQQFLKVRPDYTEAQIMLGLLNRL